MQAFDISNRLFTPDNFEYIEINKTTVRILKSIEVSFHKC